MLQHQVFDIDVDLAQFGEQAPELARLVGNEDFELRIAPRRASVLARDPSDAGVARLHDAIDGSHASAAQGAAFGRRVKVDEKIIEVVPDVLEHLDDRTGVAREDRRPQTGVGGGDPGRVPQALTREAEAFAARLDEAGRQQRGEQLRHVGDDGDRLVMGRGIHLDRHRTHVRCEGARGEDGCGIGVRVGDDDPGPSVEEIGVGAARTGPFATRHRMAADVAAREGGVVRGGCEDALDDGRLHRGDVCDDRAGEFLQRLHDAQVGDVGRRRNDDETGIVACGLGEGRARADVLGEPQRRRRGVPEHDLDAPGPQCEAEGCSEKARADDEHGPPRGEGA